MIAVEIRMRVTNEPLKHTPVVLHLDAENAPTQEVLTDRGGVARFDRPPGSGRVLVSGIERYQGRLDGETRIQLWSITQPGLEPSGMSGEFPAGSNAYPGMTTRRVAVAGTEVLTDSEGYLVDPADWSESFAKAEAALEGLVLGPEHWELIRLLREHYAQHGAQMTVRDMVKTLRGLWGPERGSSAYLHRLFPLGGPQKQGNRLAGLLRTKGEH